MAQKSPPHLTSLPSGPQVRCRRVSLTSLGFAVVWDSPPNPARSPRLNWSSLFCRRRGPWVTTGALHPCEELRARDSGRTFCGFPMSAESSGSGLWVWKWVGALQDSEGLWSRQERPSLALRHLYPNTHVPASRCAHTCKVRTHSNARAQPDSPFRPAPPFGYLVLILSNGRLQAGGS